MQREPIPVVHALRHGREVVVGAPERHPHLPVVADPAVHVPTLRLPEFVLEAHEEGQRRPRLASQPLVVSHEEPLLEVPPRLLHEGLQDVRQGQVVLRHEVAQVVELSAEAQLVEYRVISGERPQRSQPAEPRRKRVPPPLLHPPGAERAHRRERHDPRVQLLLAELEHVEGPEVELDSPAWTQGLRPQSRPGTRTERSQWDSARVPVPRQGTAVDGGNEGKSVGVGSRGTPLYSRGWRSSRYCWWALTLQ